MHPVIGGILERIVPAEGLTLPDGRFIAPDTKVGISAWVSSRDKDIYGEDSDVFRPERWLQADSESDSDFAARLRRMKECDFTFGAGRRVCTGQHLAAIELHKITATLFSHYEVRFLSRQVRMSTHSCVRRSHWTLAASNGPRDGGGSLSSTTST